MNKPVNRPERVEAEDLEDVLDAAIERAEQTNELSKDELGNVNGAIGPAGATYVIKRL